MARMRACAIIPAAGQGRRFGSPKQFLMLEGKPLFLYAIEALEASPLIEGISLVVPEGEEAFVHEVVGRSVWTKVIKILAGGRERQDSVKNGFQSLPTCDVVVVHDGVRPFLRPETVDLVVKTAYEWGSCVLGLPVKETTKEITPDGFVGRTVDRSSLWHIQTPQAFRYEIFDQALRQADHDKFMGTDEAMLVERTGHRVKVIEGSPINIKVTTPEDLEWAKSILSRGKKL